MVADATRKNTAIICHETLDGNRAVCRWFYEHQAAGTVPTPPVSSCTLTNFQAPKKDYEHRQATAEATA